MFTITETGHHLFCRPVFVGYNCKFHTSGEDQDNCGDADDGVGKVIWRIVDFLGMLHLRRINVTITHNFYSRFFQEI